MSHSQHNIKVSLDLFIQTSDIISVQTQDAANVSFINLTKWV